MKSTPQSPNPLNVLLIGNNPMELGTVLDKLNEVRAQKIITEIAFDLRSILERLMRFNPNFIFIDDNIGRQGLQETLKQLSSNRKTKDIPITVLKNSNYQEALGASSVLDYLLKQNLSADALYNTVKNSLRFRRTQLYLYKMCQKKKIEFTKRKPATQI
jgi:CheY-like chemotaxis protein